VLGSTIRDTFDHKWRSIVTKELGFESLEEMQRVRREELAMQAAESSRDSSPHCGRGAGTNGVGTGGGGSSRAKGVSR
jgi:hypothetical protein